MWGFVGAADSVAARRSGARSRRCWHLKKLCVCLASAWMRAARQVARAAQTLAGRESELARADMAAVRRLLGLRAGGDYDAGGADAVGAVGALRVVRHLLDGAAVRN